MADNVAVFPSAKNATAEYGIGRNTEAAGCLTALASGPLKTKLFGKLPRARRIGTPLVCHGGRAVGAWLGPGYSLSVPVTPTA